MKLTIDQIQKMLEELKSSDTKTEILKTVDDAVDSLNQIQAEYLLIQREVIKETR